MMPERNIARRLFVLVALAGLAMVSGTGGCSSEETAKPSVERAFLGVETTPRGLPGTDPDLHEAYLVVHQGGFPISQFAVEWGEVEPAQGIREWRPVDAHGNGAAVQQGIKLSAELLLIDNQVPGRLPGDLAGAAWDDPRVEQRAVIIVRQLAARLSPNLRYIWMGREVDAYFRQNRTELAPFGRLLAVCRDSLAVSDPGVLLGTILSYSEMAQTQSLELADSLAPAVDRLGLTVYGRDAEYAQTLTPAATLAQMTAAAARFADARVVFCEVGYPGSPSQEEQQTFAGLLTGWLGGPPANVDGAVWYCLYDWAYEPAVARAHHLYAGEDRESRYANQLQALGLHEATGPGRLAWSVVRAWNTGSVQDAPDGGPQVGLASPDRIVR